jgi:2,3,4,5-tetrahydropyridine-2-carboxylate N-succinyltransferase
MTLNQQYQALADLIDSAWEQRAGLSPSKVSSELRDAVETCLDGLETGELRVAEPGGDAGRWIVNQWLKKAVLLSFRIHGNEVIDAGYTKFFDKLPLRWGSEFGESIDQTGARVVPPATVRRGAHIGVHAPRLAAMYTFPVAWALVACWNHCRLHRRLSRTTVSSAPVPKSWKA